MEVKSVTQIDLPDGSYSGLWTGNTVRLNFGGRKLMFNVTVDVQRPDVICKIFVKDKWAFILPS